MSATAVLDETERREAMLSRIYLEHRAVLLHDVLSMTKGDWQWAEDIVQETLIRAWQHADTLDPAKGSVRAWLGRVARNVLIDGVRTNRARPGAEEWSPQARESRDRESWRHESRFRTSGDPAEGVATTLLLAKAVGRLRAEYRDVLVQLYYLDRTATQAAAALGVPVGTVKSRASHGLAALRRLVPRS